MNSLKLFCLICTTTVIAYTAESSHLNIHSEKNETGKNFPPQQKLAGNEVRPDYLNQVNATNKIILLFDKGCLLNQYLSTIRTTGLFQIVRVLSSFMERVDKRFNASEEIIKNLSETVTSLRLEMKNLSSVIFPEQTSNPPTIEIPTEPTTPAPDLKPTDSFVRCDFFRNLFREPSMR